MNPLIALIDAEGEQTAANAASRLGVSVSTVTRYGKAAGAEIVVLGAGQHTRYARPLFAYSDAAEWPLYWVDAAGGVEAFAVASLTQPGVLSVYGSGLNLRSSQDLTWPLTPLNLRGYLGRAQRASLGSVASRWDAEPERWSVAQRVFSAQSAALDHAGAVVCGDAALATLATNGTAFADAPSSLIAHYEALADAATAGRVAGSSADGEQPKFSTRVMDDQGVVREVLVKFSPPRGTPYGERWNDLLRAEAHAAATLAAAGMAVPQTRLIAGAVDAAVAVNAAHPRRTFLESARIDRVGAAGRRHLLPLAAVHAAFIAGAPQSWPNTVARLIAQRRLPADALRVTQSLFAFGQLIGNTDMHFGNLGVIAENPRALARGQFSLAPVYDMLPMRFAPGPHDDGLGYTGFAATLGAATPDAVAVAAVALATDFWRRCADDADASAAWRTFAATRADAVAL